MIEGVCKFCNGPMVDGTSKYFAVCPSSLAGERFPCEAKSQGDFMVDDVARRARKRAMFGGAKKIR